ncbi:MAG: polyprenyl diphosphate synthase [bacterium]|nr:polyprenyl diphosphate synthase [bacterium]
MDSNIPAHVAIIMDGNGRWAKERGKKRSEGHLEGSKTLKKISQHILSKGVKQLSVFAFSTENFKRDKEEVDYLMNLIIKYFKKEADTFNKNNIKVVISGRKDNLRDDVIEAINYIQNYTKQNTGGILNICLNYGGSEEIIDASKKIAKLYKEDKIDLNTLNKESFYKYLYNNLKPIDLMIRTSGELRVSNFMLYQMAYSEFYFTDKYFPDFDEGEFDKAIDEYLKRTRRFGGV